MCYFVFAFQLVYQRHCALCEVPHLTTIAQFEGFDDS